MVLSRLTEKVFRLTQTLFRLRNRAGANNLIVLVQIYYSLLELELELYFYLNTVNLSDKIIIIKITICFTLYKHDLKISIVKIEKILLYIDAVCVLSIQTKKSRQPFRKDFVQNFIPIFFTDTSKTPRSGLHFVNKGALLRYSLSITHYSSPLNFLRFLLV